jgi:hypothetical protein
MTICAAGYILHDSLAESKRRPISATVSWPATAVPSIVALTPSLAAARRQPISSTVSWLSQNSV